LTVIRSQLPPRAKHSRSRNGSRADNSFLDASACSADISSAEPSSSSAGLPLSGRKISSIEKQLMASLVRKAQHNTSPSHRYISSVSDSSSAGLSSSTSIPSFENSEDDFSSLTSAETRPRTMHHGMEASSGSQTIIGDEETRQRKVSLRFRRHNPAYDIRTHIRFI
jgi:hypothetical protein